MTARLTVADLVRHGPLPGARVHGAGGRDTEVWEVRIADRLETLDTLRPHTAVVLTGAVAQAGWNVEMALRRAWEHAAACVIVPLGAARSASTGALADRLGVPLLFIEEDPLVAAVRMASAVAQPDAGRTELVARCARRLAEEGGDVSRVIAVLTESLPGASVAFTDPAGTVLAGRRAVPSAEHTLVEVPVPGPDGGRLGALSAVARARPEGWPATVREILGLAVAPLTAWAAGRRLVDERDGTIAAAALRRLLAGSAEPAEAAALGWPMTGPLVGFALRPHAGRSADDEAVLRAAWARAGMRGTPVRYGECWVVWRTGDDLAEAERRLAQVLRLAGPHRPAVGGVSGPVPGPERLRALLDDARSAALVAASGPAGGVVRADGLGPRRLMAALPVEELRGPAEVILAPLLAADRDGTLLRTLAAVLDEGGAPQAAAERLGVHRNTVTARLERIRALGFDPNDPVQRLPLHLAARVLLDRQDAP